MCLQATPGGTHDSSAVRAAGNRQSHLTEGHLPQPSWVVAAAAAPAASAAAAAALATMWGHGAAASVGSNGVMCRTVTWVQEGTREDVACPASQPLTPGTTPTTNILRMVGLAAAWLAHRVVAVTGNVGLALPPLTSFLLRQHLASISTTAAPCFKESFQPWQSRVASL